MASADSKSDRFAFAGVSALTVLTWYALPDAVRSRPARVAIKAGLLGVSIAGAAMIPRVFAQGRRVELKPRVDLSGPALAGVALGVTAVGVASTVWFERVIFAAGERKRARGVRCAHTPAAVVMALASGAVALLDWTKLIENASES